MNNDKKIVPELRFPEFANDREWEVEPLGKLSQEIIEKTKGRKYKLMSITSGVGLVSQIEKFGREIAGESYKNYYVIHNEDFAYNKSSTKLYAEGEIAMYNDEEIGAVPNSIFTCFRFNKNKINPVFAKYPFANNLHGNWLRKFIAVGARANGALQVNNKDLFDIPFPYPSLKEQQKIASFLSSLDELIEAHDKKLEAIKDHKKGLLQNLFPQEGKKVPDFRFPEFVNDSEWEKKNIEQIAKVTTGGTPDSTNGKYWNGDMPWMNSGELNLKKVYKVANRITLDGLRESSTKLIPTRCVLIGLAGQGKTRGTAAINYIELCTNQSIASIHPNEKVFVSEFLYYKIDSMYEDLRTLSAGDGGRGGLNLQIIKSINIHLPKLDEQKKIAAFLSSLDDLITAHTEKIEQLKLHKKGLLQELFPRIND